MANLEQRKWDRFEMAVLRGKTMGILGMGDIGKACARLGKAFGMRVVALRRNMKKASAHRLPPDMRFTCHPLRMSVT